jgi:hypothetical protein
VRLDHADAFTVDGTNDAVPGFTMPPLKLAPFNCTVWKRFEYDEMFKPFERVGRPAVPPGNVIVKVEFGATASGAMTPMAMSCFWMSVCPATTAEHETPWNTCVVSTSAAPAGDAPPAILNVATLRAARPP